MGKVTGLYGDGGAGKTTLANQLGVAVDLGLPFLGMDVTQGTVFALLAENDEDDSHITIEATRQNYGILFFDLRGRFRVASRAGQDNLLMAVANRELDTTVIYQMLREELRKDILIEKFSGSRSSSRNW